MTSTIRQFDVFRTPFRKDKAERPYYVVVQSDRYQTHTRACAPLVAERFLKPMGRLTPLFELDGKGCYLHPIEMVPLPVTLLRVKVTNLEADRYRIIGAIDLVFTGV